jgi:hypothetical protein
MLEAILIYWMSLTFMLKGLLEHIKRISFRFLWSRDKEKREISLVKWQRIVVLKEKGQWGLKNIHYFFKALEKKSVWRTINGNVL